MKIADISVEYIQHVGSDLMVANAARVSFDKESEWEKNGKFGGTDQDLSVRDEKLIKYLATHKHTSPFNHSFITVRVKAPIFVARQLVKHKFMPWNEVSRRYVDDEPEFYFREFHKRAPNLKQGSTGEPHKDLPYGAYTDGMKLQLANYLEAIDLGAAPEDARMLLPQNMMTEWYWSGTLGAYCDMLRLRLEQGAQYDSRIVAEKIRDILQPHFPVSLPWLLVVN